MTRNSVLLAGTALFLSGVACGDARIRGCPWSPADPGAQMALDGMQITYEAVIPSDCPVPLGNVGERKFVGAQIMDRGPLEGDFANVRARNDGRPQRTVSANVTPFVYNSFFNWSEANPTTAYWAGTGYNEGGTTTDYGQFDIVYQPELQIPTTYGILTIQYYWSSIATTIRGPELPTEFSVGTWDAPTSGGTQPYSYAWYRDGQLVSTASAYSASVGDYQFGLRVQVTDQTTASRWADYWVHVNGVRVAISGPTVVYYSEGGGTWTVEGRGGFAPYTFDWYIDDESSGRIWVGSGPSWSGYPGEGGRRVSVDMRDSRGATHGTAYSVNGIGNDQCAPTPPAITC